MPSTQEYKEAKRLAEDYVPPPVSLGQTVLYWEQKNRPPVPAIVVEKYDDNRPDPSPSKLIRLNVLGAALRTIPEVRHTNDPLAWFYGAGRDNPGAWDYTPADKRLGRLDDRLDRHERRLESLEKKTDQFLDTAETAVEREKRFRRLEQKAGIKGKPEPEAKTEPEAQAA